MNKILKNRDDAILGGHMQPKVFQNILFLPIIGLLSLSNLSFGMDQGNRVNQIHTMDSYLSGGNAMYLKVHKKNIRLERENDYLKSVADPEARKLYDKKFSFSGMFRNAVQEGVENGISDAVQGTVYSVLTTPLKAIQQNVNGFFGLIGLYLYRVAFGSLGLSWSTLAKLNNRIYTLCIPFTGPSAGDTVKKRRAELIAGDTEEVTENNWLPVKEDLIKELEHAIAFLKRSSNSYNKSYQDYCIINPKYYINRIMHAFAPHDNEEVCFYIDRTINYLEKLIESIKAINNFEEIEQKAMQIKRWLTWSCNSFEQIALILQAEGGARPTNGLNFLKPTIAGGNQAAGMGQLADILGSGPALQL